MTLELVPCSTNDTKGFGIDIGSIMRALDRDNFQLDMLSQVDVEDYIVNLNNNRNGVVTDWDDLSFTSIKYIGVLKIGEYVVHPKFHKYIGVPVQFLYDNDEEVIGWEPIIKIEKHVNTNKRKVNISIIKTRSWRQSTVVKKHVRRINVSKRNSNS